MDSDTRVVRTDDYVSTTIDDEEVILHLGSGTYFGVEGVGAEIWDLAGSEPRVGDIETAIQEAFDIRRDRVERDVEAFLSELESESLVELLDDA